MMSRYKDLFNFRDLGGLRTKDQKKVKSGLVYRTGNISHLTEETAEFLVEKLEIKTYIDFRGKNEIQEFGEPKVLLSAGIEWVNIHIEADDPDFAKISHPQPKDWVQLYVRLFEKNKAGWAQFLKIIQESKKPLMYGCLFGKDRTGIGTGLLLDRLSVEKNEIIKDYSKTTEGLFPNVEKLSKIWQNTKLTEEEVAEHYLKAHPEILSGFLDHYLDSSHQNFQMVVGNAQQLDEGLRKKLIE